MIPLDLTVFELRWRHGAHSYFKAIRTAQYDPLYAAKTYACAKLTNQQVRLFSLRLLHCGRLQGFGSISLEPDL
jgi:hypothetical protein